MFKNQEVRSLHMKVKVPEKKQRVHKKGKPEIGELVSIQTKFCAGFSNLYMKDMGVGGASNGLLYFLCHVNHPNTVFW